MIRIFSNKFSTAPDEVHPLPHAISLKDWLQLNVKNYDDRTAPFSCTVNGEHWPEARFNEPLPVDGTIDLMLEPKDAATAVIAIMAVVGGAVAAKAMAKKMPDTYNRTTPAGSSIYDVNLQGNRARLNGIIPEIAGTHGVFPDYLNQPHRFYKNGVPCVDLLLSIGVGQYQLGADDIKIAQTPISRYLDNISYALFEPGANISSHPAYQNWFQSAEVSESGFELTTPPGLMDGNANTYIVTNQNRFTVSKTGQYGPAVELQFKLDDYLYINGRTNNLTTFEGIAAVSGNIISAPGIGRYQVAGQIIGLMGKGINGGYQVETVSANQITLTGMAGEAVSLPAAVSQYIRIAKTRTSGILGLYKVTAVSSDKKEFTVTKVDQPGWTAFPTDYRFYYNTYIEPITDLKNWQLGPYLICPQNETTDKIEVDFFIPGMGRINDDGTISTIDVYVNIMYRVLGTIDWTIQTVKFSRRSMDEYGQTVIISVAKATYEVAIIRTTAAFDDIQVKDKVVCKRVKSRLNTVTRYSGITTMAMSIVGNNALADSAESRILCKPTRILARLSNNSWIEPGPTNAIADFFGYAVKDAGHSDSTLSLPDLQTFKDKCTTQNQSFNAVFDNDSTLLDVLQRILYTGYAEPVLEFGQLYPVREDPQTIHRQFFSPDNMLTDSLKIEFSNFKPDEPDGVEVEYMDPDTWKTATIKCLLPGDAGIKPEKIRAFGVTNKTQAWRIGMRVRARMKYVRKFINFSTELDAHNAQFASLIAVADNIRNQSGRVTTVTAGKTLKLNQPLTWTANTQHVIAIRRPNGSLFGPVNCSKGSSDDEVILERNLDFSATTNGRMEPPFYIFGTIDRWAHSMVVKNVTPSGSDKLKVEAESYDARVFLNDLNSPG